MATKSIRVMIVENNTTLLKGMETAFRMRGFEVEGAKNVEEARDSIRRMTGQIDVAVLDMELNDLQEEEGFTGADLGLELLKTQGDRRPEFLIYSDFTSRADYYRKAVHLHVAAYLDKRLVDVKTVASHVRVLALRRELSFSNETLLEEVRRLAEASRDEGAAIAGFCDKILKPAIDGVLGMPFVLLLSDDRLRQQGKTSTTAYCGGGLDLPRGALEIYSAIQKVLFLPGVAGATQAMERELLQESGFVDEEGVLDRLHGAPFVALAEKGAFRLSLGLLAPDREADLQFEQAEALVALMSRYFRDSVLQQLLHVAELWSQAEAKKNRLIEDTANLFLNVGREQVTILDDATRAGEIVTTADLIHIPKLQALGEDLRDAGEALKNLGEEPEPPQQVDLAPLIQNVWEVVAGMQELPSGEFFQITGQVAVEGSSERLYAVFSRVLRWFAERHGDSVGDRGSIRVVLSAEGDHAVVSVEDDGPRLASTLRRHLFDPFALGGWRASKAPWRAGRRLSLYLAKLLLEGQPGSFLQDRTDELQGVTGHRLTIRLPLAG
jgi:ActR/RegA family two-component response regulator